MHTLRSALLLSTVGFSTVATAATPIERAEPGRLPPGVVPLHYAISVDPDAAKLSFTGSETIDIAVARPTATIMLNAAELAVGNVRLDSSIAPVRTTLDETAQTLTLTFAKPIAAGAHKLALTWSGKINQSAAGMFAVDYKDGARDQRLLVTQFEAADGRRFAPMWDEPARKATFALTVATPKGQTSFSNMPVASTAPGTGNKKLVTFKTTPKMSSYLLFLGQGDVERRTRQVGPTEIGVITRRGALDQGDYALEVAAKVLTYYNDYFGTPYPLPKLDMVAAPGSSQFFSAMENWGAILYFDRVVLIDPKITTESQRQTVFNVIAHEMAHQWFGDLVTMRWWEDLWLNEGFASWMASKVTNDLNPDWHVAAQTVAGARQQGLNVDARSSTHAIVQPVATPDELASAFDAITYLKGEAVIRMLEGVVGPDAFRAGIRNYMKAHAYSNTVTDDLWAAVGGAARRPVKPFMDTFTRQPGVPLIRVGEPACGAGSTRLTLTQGRFGVDAPSKAPLKWTVPVTLAGGRAVDVTAAAPATGTVTGCAPAPVVNPGQQGYYRTLYAPGLFAALSDRVATLPLADQVGTLADTFALGNGEYVSHDRFFALVDKLPAGADPLVWQTAASELYAIHGTLAGDPARAAYDARVRAVLAPQFARVGFEAKRGEPSAIAQLRETLIGVLGQIGDPQVVDGVRRYVAGGLDDIPAAVREPVLGVYAYNATPAEWEKLHAAALAEKNPGVQRAYWSLLGANRDPALAQGALDLALTEEATVPNRSNLIRGASDVNPTLTFDWAVTHADQVNALIEASSRQNFIVGLGAGATDAAVADRIQAYADKALPATARRQANLSIATVRYRARLRGIQSAPAARWAGRG